jgi:hypothetical protein
MMPKHILCIYQADSTGNNSQTTSRDGRYSIGTDRCRSAWGRSPAFVPLCWAGADDLLSDLWVMTWQPCSPGPGDETAIDKRKRNCLASARFRQKKKAEMQARES